MLDAEGTIGLNLTLVVDPRDAKLNNAFGFDQTVQQALFGIAWILFDERPERIHDLFDGLHEFRLMRVTRLDLFQELVETG